MRCFSDTQMRIIEIFYFSFVCRPGVLPVSCYSSRYRRAALFYFLLNRQEH